MPWNENQNHGMLKWILLFMVLILFLVHNLNCKAFSDTRQERALLGHVRRENAQRAQEGSERLGKSFYCGHGHEHLGERW